LAAAAIWLFASTYSSHLCNAFEQPEKTIATNPLERWLHLEKAFLRRVLLLTDSQEILLDSIKVEQTNSRKVPGGIRPPIDISRDRVQQKADIVKLLDEGTPRTLDHRIAIRNLEREITKLLTDDQIIAYRKEQIAREQFAQDASALGVTLLLNDKLNLTLSQIDLIRTDLSHWRGVAAIHVEAYEASDSFLPRFNDTLVRKHLTPKQFTTFVGYRQVEITSESSAKNPIFDPILIAR
jgi:hypothetical protein